MIERLRRYLLDRIGVRSPSLSMLGIRPSMRWVLGDLPTRAELRLAHAWPITVERARVILRGVDGNEEMADATIRLRQWLGMPL